MSDTVDDGEQFRMSHAGLVARSAEGHAAKGMKIKDQEDMWVEIQHHTFRNWVNVQLRETGLKVQDLCEDLRDGLALVTLVETLQKRRLRKVKRVMNQHQALENVTTALNAIADDGIKLVNIGNVDIVNGNLKLILGLIWSLIMHYQIGQSKFPPKKLMLTWLKAVLPDCRVHNFTSDWNSGVYLSALLDYCHPGLFSNWKNLNPRNAVSNCKNAMEIAKAEFNIPMIIEPEILASPYLDDLSGMTYLSYFMKEGGPGYKATLEWARQQLPGKKVDNFTSDWNSGLYLTQLVKQLGGPVPGYKHLHDNPDTYESNIQLGLDGGRRLGVEPVLAASDMARPDVESLANMGYIAYYQWVQARDSPSDSVTVKCDLDNVRINNPVPFKIDFLTKEVVLSEVRVEVRGPSGPIRVDLDLGPRGGQGVFVPDEVGIYELVVVNEDEVVDGCPVKVRALPDVSKIMFHGIDPCALGSIVEVVINSNGAGGSDIDVTAYSPTGRALQCPVKEEDGVYAATFQPDEAGEWSIAVTYDEEHIQGSPFSCHVYDPQALKLRELDKGPSSSPGKPFTFLVDATKCGWGEATVDVTQGGRSVPSKSLEIDHGLYEVTFTPLEAARHKIYAYFNGHEIKGSPFSLYLGVEQPPERKDSKKKKKSSSKENKEVKEIVKEYSGSALINSPRYSSSSNDSPQKSAILTKTYDSSSLNRSSLNTSKTLHDTYDSSINRSSLNTSKNLQDTYDSSSINRSSLNTSKNLQDTYNSSSINRSSLNTSKNLQDTYDSSSLNRSSLNTSKNLQDTYDSSSLNRSSLNTSKTLQDTYDSSSINRSSRNTSKTLQDKTHDTNTTATTTSSYEAINNKYANFESASVVNRSFDSTTRRLSYDAVEESPPPTRITYEGNPPKIGYESLTSTARKSLNFESSSPVKVNFESSTPVKVNFESSSPVKLNTSSSSFNSSFNTSASTVINSTSVFNKSSSPARLPSPGPRKSASPSPPPPAASRTARSVSPPVAPPESLTCLSSPSKVLQITQNAAKTTEGTSFFYSSVANMKILPSTY